MSLLNRFKYEYIFITEKEPYCSNDPTEATPKTIGPERYTREVGAKALLTCVEGYEPKPAGQVEAICKGTSPEKGTWQTTSTCEGTNFLFLIRSFEDFVL